jgi:N-acetylmuramoyl-L-alanine amidase
MLSIRNHRLVGEKVSFQQTPNTGGGLSPRFVVLHYTAGSSLASSVHSLCTRKPRGNASAHLVLGRDGSIVQLAAFNTVTWHAGVSQWNGLSGLNQHAIGIEMDNAGGLHREGERFVSWFGKAFSDKEVVLAAHRFGGGVQPWHAYTQAQIERSLELCDLLVNHYGLEDVLGHEDIARGRKQDPGPAFPLASVRSRALGRDADALPRRLVNTASLNIRSGPGAQFDKVAPALKRGTELLILEQQDRWSHTAVVGATDLEGWVCNDFLAPLPATRSAPMNLPRSVRATPAGTASRARAKPATPAARKAAKPVAKQTPKGSAKPGAAAQTVTGKRRKSQANANE